MIMNTSKHAGQLIKYDIYEEEKDWLKEGMYLRMLSVASESATQKDRDNLNKAFNRAYHASDDFLKAHKFKT